MRKARLLFAQIFIASLLGFFGSSCGDSTIYNVETSNAELSITTTSNAELAITTTSNAELAITTTSTYALASSEDFSLTYKDVIVINQNGVVDETLLIEALGDSFEKTAKIYGSSPYTGSTCISINGEALSMVIMQSDDDFTLISCTLYTNALSTYRGVSIGDSEDKLKLLYPHMQEFVIADEVGLSIKSYILKDGYEFGNYLNFLVENSYVTGIEIMNDDP